MNEWMNEWMSEWMSEGVKKGRKERMDLLQLCMQGGVEKGGGGESRGPQEKGGRRRREGEGRMQATERAPIYLYTEYI